MSSITSGPDWERLKALWDGITEYLVLSNRTYRVLTPNGYERPIFVQLQDSDLYGSTSTGAMRPPGVEPSNSAAGSMKPQMNRRTKTGEITKNPRLTDVGGE